MLFPPLGRRLLQIQTRSPSAGVILSTTDEGASWSSLSIGSNSLTSVSFVNAMDGWAVGLNGTILATTNGGMSWSPQTSGTMQELDGVAFANANDGWAVGAVGTILFTTNGGATWSTQTSGTSEGLHAVAALVNSNAVPEPNSLFQCGLGLSLAFGYVWFQGQQRRRIRADRRDA